MPSMPLLLLLTSLGERKQMAPMGLNLWYPAIIVINITPTPPPTPRERHNSHARTHGVHIYNDGEKEGGGRGATKPKTHLRLSSSDGHLSHPDLPSEGPVALLKGVNLFRSPCRQRLSGRQGFLRTSQSIVTARLWRWWRWRVVVLVVHHRETGRATKTRTGMGRWGGGGFSCCASPSSVVAHHKWCYCIMYIAETGK